MKRPLLLLACAIVLLAGALRVRHAMQRQSLWSDEAYDFAMVTESDTIGELDAKVMRDGHPPLHYWIEWICYRVGGERALLERWPHVFLGTAAVGLVMLLAWRWFGARCALLTGLLAAHSPYLIYYSAELRSYALLAATAPIFGLAYLRFFDRRDRRSAILWGLSAALIAYAHYFGFFAIIAGGLWYVAHDRTRGGFRRAATAGITFTIAFAPWMPAFIWQLDRDLQPWATPNTDPVELIRTLKLTASGSGWLILFASLLAGGVMLYRSRERRPFFALVVVALGAGALAWTMQLWRGAWELRYLIAYVLLLLPPACVYLSRMGTLGEVTFWRFRLSPRVHGAIGIVLIITLIGFQWRDRKGWLRKRITPLPELIEVLGTQGRPSDLIVVGGGWSAPAFLHEYHGPLAVVAPPHAVEGGRLVRRQFDSPEARAAAFEEQVEAIGRHLRDGGRVWILTGGSPIALADGVEVARFEPSIYEFHYAQTLTLVAPRNE